MTSAGYVPDELEAAPAGGVDHRFYLLLAGLSVGFAWVLQFPSSFWLDEAGTYWIVSDGLEQAWNRSLKFQVQTPLYLVLLWPLARVWGASEIILRIPSGLAMAIATIGVYRLGRSLVTERVGWLAAVCFIPLPVVASAAGDARPYALAVAFTVWATVVLVRWTDEPDTRGMIAYVGLTALAVATHPLFVLAVPSHLAFLMVRSERRLLHRFLTALASIAVLSVPSVLAASATLGTTAQLSVPAPTSAGTLLRALLPPVVVLGSLLAAVVGIAGSRATGLGPVSARRGTALLLAGWALFPATLLWLVTATTNASLFVPRYLTISAPASAILLGWGLSSLADETRRERATTVLVAVLLAGAWVRTGTQGWREAVAEANRFLGTDAGLVLVQGSFIESASDEYFTIHEEGRGWLLAPLSAYPVSEHHAVIPMPHDRHPAPRPHLDRASAQAKMFERVVLLTGEPHSALPAAVTSALGASHAPDGPPRCHSGVCLTFFTRHGD